MFDAGVTTRAAELLSCVRMGVADVDWYVHAPTVVVERVPGFLNLRGRVTCVLRVFELSFVLKVTCFLSRFAGF